MENVTVITPKLQKGKIKTTEIIQGIHYALVVVNGSEIYFKLSALNFCN